MGHSASSAVEGLLPASKIAVCRDYNMQGWDFVQTGKGVQCQEFTVSGGFQTPVLISTPDIVPGSPLAAVKGGATHPARLYYRDTSGHIREMLEDNGRWSVSSRPFPLILPGSSLTVTAWDGLNHVRLYFQDMQRRVCEYCYDHGSGWYPGENLTPPLPPVPLAVVSHEKKTWTSSLVTIDLFLISEGSVRRISYDSAGGKWLAMEDVGGMPAVDSPLAAAEDKGGANPDCPEVVCYFDTRGRVQALRPANRSVTEVSDQSDIRPNSPLSLTVLRNQYRLGYLTRAGQIGEAHPLTF